MFIDSPKEKTGPGRKKGNSHPSMDLIDKASSCES